MIGNNKQWVHLIVVVILLICVTKAGLSTSPHTKNDGSWKIDPTIYSLLENQTEVMVFIVLEKDKNIINGRFASLRDKDNAIIHSNRQMQSTVLDALEKKNFDLKHQYGLINVLYGEVTTEGLKRLEKNPKVRRVYVPRPIYPSTSESLSLINVKKEVWAEGITGNGEVVCVVDTGISYTNSAFGNCARTNNINDGSCDKVIGGFDIGGNDTDPYDDSWPQPHGTHVAAVVAGNKGVAPDAKLVAVKIAGNVSRWGETTLSKGILWCTRNAENYSISTIQISINIGGHYSGICDDTALQDSVESAVGKNITVVVSTGNDGFLNKIASPACSPGAIPIGAVYDSDLGREPDSGTYQNISPSMDHCYDQDAKEDKIACFTNRGSKLHLLAPGGKISAIANREGWGTSLAAPHVSGTVALLQEFNKKKTMEDYWHLMRYSAS